MKSDNAVLLLPIPWGTFLLLQSPPLLVKGLEQVKRAASAGLHVLLELNNLVQNTMYSFAIIPSKYPITADVS